jgi:hypothetical protein
MNTSIPVPETEPGHRRWRVAAVLGLSLPLFAWVARMPRLAQDLEYHAFADQRRIFGIPHFWNVASNLPFAVIGLLGCYWLSQAGRNSTAFAEPAERFGYFVFFVGEFLTCFGSGYYHSAPSNETLVWDRLVFSLMLTSFFAIVLTEFVSQRVGRLLLLPVVLLGVYSVVYWRMSELAGRGDLRLYILVQFYPVIAIPFVMLLFRSRYTHAGTFLLTWALYGLAKAFELYDRPIYELTGFWSGHTFKHLVAAGASYALLHGLRQRCVRSQTAPPVHPYASRRGASAIGGAARGSGELLTLLVSGVMLATVVPATAGGQAPPVNEHVPRGIHPELVVLADELVERSWRATPGLIHTPSDLKQIEPGQCVRFGVLAPGDDSSRLLASAKMGFELTFGGRLQTFTPELPDAVKQVKDAGEDLVHEMVGPTDIKFPHPSLAASRARWCAPLDAPDGTATVRATVAMPDSKIAALNPRGLEVRTFETARRIERFSDINTLGPWLQHYHAAPDPASLLPAVRIVATDSTSRSMAHVMVFFVQALKASPAAANDLLRVLPAENRSVRSYGISLLMEAGYPTAPLLAGLDEKERDATSSVHAPNPFDLTPDRTLPNRMDMLWAVFFATGRIEPVRAVASQLAWRSDYQKFEELRKSGGRPSEATPTVMRAVAYVAAGWSLRALSAQDGLVADYVEALKSSPETAANVKEELASLHTNPAFIRR